MMVNVSNYTLGKFLAGAVNDQREEGKTHQVLSKLDVLFRLRAERNRQLEALAEQMEKEMAAAAAQTQAASGSKAKRFKDAMKALHQRPQWHLLPDVVNVSVQLLHREAPLTCKVLKGRANDAVWINVTQETMELLSEEMQFVLRNPPSPRMRPLEVAGGVVP